MYGCSSIKIVTIPNGITEIGEAAFASCTGLTTVSLPSSLATIRESAFWGCTSLTSISFPNALVTIGEGAFYGCTGITEIVCPSTLRTIGWGAFEACSNLSKVTLNNGLETISGRAFSGTGITSITIPKTIKNLYGSTYYTSASCFYEAEHLKTVVFEYGILSIPYRALFGCSSVINIVLPSSVEEIGQYAFYGCSSITDITIDETVTRIDENAFDDCTSLTTFHVVKNSFAHQYAINKGYNVEFIDCTHTKTEIDEDYPATCTESGYQTTICSFCRETIERKTIDPLGHEWTIISVIREATCTYEGYAKVICSRCGLVTENATEKAPHNYVLKSEREATCTRQGIMIYECSVCHEQKEERTEPIGHIDVNNDKLCDVCGTLALGESDVGGQCGDTAYWIFIEPTSTLRIFGTGDLWDYVEPSDGQVHLSGPGAPWNSIEATAYGKAISKVVFDTGITGVGNGIFIGSSVSQIIFSETITKIGYMAFYNCKGLTEVVFPDSVAQIEERAFWSCENLSAITFGNNLKTIGKDAFGLCRALTILNLPSCVEEIGDGAFAYCYLLTSVTLSNSLLSIGKEAFKGCSALQAVQIPAHVYEIGRGAFWNCNAISGFVVDVNNGFYSSDDRGALYNKDKTSLIQYPHGAAYIYNFDVPDTVRTIEERAFEAVNIGCVTMTHVTAIQNKAFVESPLSTLKLSNRIRSIGTDAFHYAWLHTVYFDGTQEQWATVSIAEGNDELQNADFHFTGNGSINYTPGDINGDGVLNNKDLNRLMKFLAGDDVEVVEEALDLNGDGNVNNKDLNRLMKYLAGEDVEIY